MNFPSIPSDNLYKFICIASLASIILSMYYFSTAVQELDVEVQQLKGDSDLLETEIEWFTIVVDSLSENATDDRRTELFEIQRELLIKNSKLGNSSKLARLKLEEIKKNRKIFTIMIIPLLIDFIYGLTLWYFKVQRHQDKLLKHQVENLEAEKK
ncbi:MAG: hypothetical protein IH949_10600 [Bacteroidetes bacterium]|nr:hypothetical protein [Bacteroidota bacterium]